MIRLVKKTLNFLLILFRFIFTKLKRTSKHRSVFSRHFKLTVPPSLFPVPWKRGGRFLGTAIAALIFTISFSGINLWFTPPAHAASLYIEPLTWDFMGLDSNNPNVGPDRYLIGARVCNVGSDTAENLVVKFVREGAYNPNIILEGSATISTPQLISGSTPASNHNNTAQKPANCFDAYYLIRVNRTSAAHDTVQRYRIEASADNAGIVDTNSALGSIYGKSEVNQQLYVEKILSQARNAVLGFENVSAAPNNTGNTVYVGGTYTFRLTAQTATAYPQLTISSDFPNIVFQFLDIKTVYSSDPSFKNSSIYGDACGWLGDPGTVGYHESSSACEGPIPNQDSADGKVGNTVTTEYTLKVLGLPTKLGYASDTVRVNHLILDFSGGSYHYNSDFGSGLGFADIIVKDSSADLQISKTHTDNFATGDNTYTLQVKNNGPDAARGQLTVTDTLPSGFTYKSASSTDPWTCAASGQVVTCTNPNTNTMAVNATSTIKLTVNVTASAATYSLNKVSVTSGSTDPNLSNNYAADPTTVLTGANINLTKTHTPTTFVVGSTGTYTLTVSNTSSFDSIGPIVITDPLPNGLSFVSGTGTAIAGQNWTCGASGQNVTCTNPANLVAGASSTVTLTVGVGSSAVPTGQTTGSVTNTATVTSSNFDPSTSNNTATDITPTTQPVPDLKIEKTHTGNFVQTGNNAYTITVTNVGVQTTSGAIDVTDIFPSGAGMTYQSVSGTNWTCKTNCTVGSAGPVTFTNPGPLAPNQSTSFTVIVKPANTGTFNSPGNQVDVTTPGDTTAGGNNRATDPTTVVAPPSQNSNQVDVIVKKTITTLPTTNSRTVVYQIDVSEGNAGGKPDDPAAFTDVIPSQISFTRPSGITCTVLDAKSICGSETGTGQTVSFAGMTLNKGTAGVRITITGTLSAGFSGTISNTGTAQPTTSGVTDINPADNSSTAVFTYNEADLTISKTPPSANVVQNGVANYTLTVTNSGTSATSGLITVTDTLATGLTFSQANSASGSSGWSCSNSGQIVTCINPGPLAVNQSSSINLRVNVTASSGTIPNTATVSTPGETKTTNNTSSTANVTVIPPNSDLIITKAGAATIGLGQTLSYTLTVKNQGTTTAVATTNPITVTDTLPTGLAFLSANGPGWTCATTQVSGQDKVTCTSNTDIAANDTSVITINTLVGTSTISPINNSATVALTGETVTNNNTSNTVTTTISQSADLAIVKTISGNLVAGQNATYQLKVTNNGPSHVSSNVWVIDNLPTGLTFQSFTDNSAWTCTNTANSSPCAAGATQLRFDKASGLALGTSSTITLNVAVSASAPSSITNSATVSSNVNDPVASNNSSQITNPVQPLEADLVLTKSHIGTFTIGKQGTYTLAVTNKGPATAAPITIVDTLPSNLSFVSAIGLNWTCFGSPTVTCNYSHNLAAGESTAVDIIVLVGSGTPTGNNSITNKASASSTTPDPTSSNNTNILDPTTIAAGADLQVTKTHTGSFAVGSTGNYYTITVTNNGTDQAAANIKVIDDLLVGVHYSSSSSTDFACTSDNATDANTVTCTRTTAMNAGTSSTIRLNVDVLNTIASPVINNVSVGSPTTDPNPSNNLFTESFNLTSGSKTPMLLLVKRLTAINGNAIANFVDETTGAQAADDNNSNWPSDLNTYLRGAITRNDIKPKDQLEYTIYFLSAGTADVSNVTICDLIPTHTTFASTAFNGMTPLDTGATAGTDSGIAIANSTTLSANPTAYMTSNIDSDRGSYYPAGTTPPTACTKAGTNTPLTAADNTNGLVAVNVVKSTSRLPRAIASGNPANSYGFIRFRVTVK